MSAGYIRQAWCRCLCKQWSEKFSTLKLNENRLLCFQLQSKNPAPLTFYTQTHAHKGQQNHAIWHPRKKKKKKETALFSTARFICLPNFLHRTLKIEQRGGLFQALLLFHVSSRQTGSVIGTLTTNRNWPVETGYDNVATKSPFSPKTGASVS